MPGRIHIIDPDEARRSSLRAALEGAYFTVMEGEADIGLSEGAGPDLIIIDESAARADAAPETPVILTARRAGADMSGLFARLGRGVDDILLYPFDPRVALARVRNLIRLKIMRDELALREATARELGFGGGPVQAAGAASAEHGRILLVAPPSPATTALGATLEARTGARCEVAPPGFAAVRAIEIDAPDAVIVADSVARLSPAGAAGFAEAEDAVGVIAAIRSRGEARHAAILHLSECGAPFAGSRGAGARRAGAFDREARRVAAALDAGATDCAALAEDPVELVARLGAQLRRKLQTDALRAALDEGVRSAATDPLTGLFGRRYFDAHCAGLVERARRERAPLAALIFDVDRFKRVNDDHGHVVGDQTLAAFAARLRACMRSADLVARYGGEEFVAIMPNASEKRAIAAAERVRRMVARAPVTTEAGAVIPVTVSVGVAGLRAEDGPDSLLLRADIALRAAKCEGRDCVRLAAA